MSVDPKEITRRENGTIAARPPGSGSKRGSFQKLTRRMKEEFARYTEQHGEAANPLICLCEIMRDEKTEPQIRVGAAAKLAQFLIPKKFELEEAEPDQEKIASLKRFRAAILGALPDQSHPTVALIEGETREVHL